MPDQRKILIIDDERDIVHVLTVRLRAAGYAVLTAPDGPSGLRAAAENLPDAIIMDIRMPGMDGFEVLDRLKQSSETKAIPVVALSANVVEHVRTQVLAAGARCFVAKPFQPAKLLAALESTIGGSDLACQRPTLVGEED